MRALGPGYVASVQVGRESAKPFPVAVDVSRAPPRSSISLRAKLVRVGGVEPAARFEARAEDAFTLDVSEEAARALAQHLYREVDLVAVVDRSADGSIESGRLVQFEVLDADTDPRVAWRA